VKLHQSPFVVSLNEKVAVTSWTTSSSAATLGTNITAGARRIRSVRTAKMEKNLPDLTKGHLLLLVF
jgi:hypothetical protein